MLFKLSKNTYSVSKINNFFNENECGLLINFDWEKLNNPEYIRRYSWFLDKITNIVSQVNDFSYLFDIIGLTDFHIREYTFQTSPEKLLLNSDLNHYENTSIRKLSVFVFLSQFQDYMGGQIVFQPTDERFTQEQGNLIIFPSMRQYIVEPVIEGSLKILAGWVYGPPFK